MHRPGQEIGHRNRAPLVYILTPWGLGLIVSHFVSAIGEYDDRILILAILCSLAAIATSWMKQSNSIRNPVWGIVFITGSFLGGWVHGSMHLPEALPASWNGLPPRQARMTVQVNRIRFQPESDKAGSCAFTGSITSAPPVMTDKTGYEVSAFLFKPADTLPLLKGSLVHGTGVLKWGKWSYFAENPIPNMPLLEWNAGEVLSVDNNQIHPADHLRAKVLSQIDDILSLNAPQNLTLDAYLKSMVTGSKAYLDKASKKRFQATGLMHFLAISGFHMSILVLSLVIAGKAIRLPNSFSALAIIAISATYVWITGASPSAQRAWIMVLFYFAAAAVKRKPNPYAALVAAACVILWVDPRQMSDPGFQLSFTIVAGIIGYGTALIRQFNLRLPPDRFLTDKSTSKGHRLRVNFLRMIIPPLAISWIAFWISAPLIAFHFGSLPLSTFVLNPILGSMFAISLITAFLSLALGAIGLLGVAGFVNYAAWLNLSIIHYSTTWMAPISWLRIPLQPTIWGCHTATLGALVLLTLINHHHPRIPLRTFLIVPGWIVLVLSTDALVRILSY